MNGMQRVAGRAGVLANVALGLAFLGVIAVDALVVANRHGNWSFECLVGVAICAVALMRQVHRPAAAASALAFCGIAAIVANDVHAPSQPGPAAAAGLLVLGAACIRVARPALAAGIALAGVAVAIVGRIPLKPEYAIAFALLGILLWTVALVIGLWLRVLDIRNRQLLDATRTEERLTLARELHDVVAHHVTGIVVQAQAARLVAGERSTSVDEMLIAIEWAGTDALTAMRRVVGLLRDATDGPGVSPSTGDLQKLVERFSAHGPTVELHLPDFNQSDWPPETASACTA